MKTAQVRSLSRHLLPHMRGYTHKGRMLYVSPLNHILRRFYFEDSDIDRSAFYLWVFFLPLYIPATYISFNFGERLGERRFRRWTLKDPRLLDELLECIQRDGLPFLEVVRRPCDVVPFIHQFGNDSDPYNLEAISYSVTMTDDVAAAQEALERLTNALDSSISWQAEMTERATLLARKLAVDPQEARNQLAEWELATVKNLELD